MIKSDVISQLFGKTYLMSWVTLLTMIKVPLCSRTRTSSRFTIAYMYTSSGTNDLCKPLGISLSIANVSPRNKAWVAWRSSLSRIYDSETLESSRIISIGRILSMTIPSHELGNNISRRRWPSNGDPKRQKKIGNIIENYGKSDLRVPNLTNQYQLVLIPLIRGKLRFWDCFGI